MLILRRIAIENRDTKYPQDPSKLLEKSLKDFIEVNEKMVEQHGVPDYVFVSPFASARKSAETLPEDYRIIYDPEIGKHITNRKLLIQKETEDLLPVFDSNIEDFKNRVAHRFRRLVQIGSSRVIWVITHTDVMKEILTSQHKKDIPRDIPVTYVVAMTCTLSRVANPQQPKTLPVMTMQKKEREREKSKLKTKITKEKETPICRKCKRNECICDAISASLDSFCQKCQKEPCVCIKHACMDCMTYPCECDHDGSSEDPFSAY